MGWGWVKNSGKGINLDQENRHFFCGYWRRKDEELQIQKITAANSRKFSKFKQYGLYFLFWKSVKVSAKSEGNHL